MTEVTARRPGATNLDPTGLGGNVDWDLEGDDGLSREEA